MPNSTAERYIQMPESKNQKPSVPEIPIRMMPNTRWWRCTPLSLTTLPGHQGTRGLRIRRVLRRMKPNEPRKPTSTQEQALAAVVDELVLPEVDDE